MSVSVSVCVCECECVCVSVKERECVSESGCMRIECVYLRKNV